MVLAIIQARTSSSRFPCKVLKNILEIPMIIHQIERIKNSTTIDAIVLATSEDDSDNELEIICRQHGVAVFRGSLLDVLDRFYCCAQLYHADHVLRLTGDCPIIDWEIIDLLIAKHLMENNDYTSNTLEPTYPDGLDVEIMKMSVLETAWRNAVLPSEREHVTPYIYKNPQKFKLGCLKNNIDLSTLRWTVDEPEDFAFITNVYKNLYSDKKNFLMKDVLLLLEKYPDINKMNNMFQRNEGMEKSFAQDERFIKKEGRKNKWLKY